MSISIYTKKDIFKDLWLSFNVAMIFIIPICMGVTMVLDSKQKYGLVWFIANLSGLVLSIHYVIYTIRKRVEKIIYLRNIRGLEEIYEIRGKHIMPNYSQGCIGELYEKYRGKL